jgi:hypothetical protein
MGGHDRVVLQALRLRLERRMAEIQKTARTILVIIQEHSIFGQAELLIALRN